MRRLPLLLCLLLPLFAAPSQAQGLIINGEATATLTWTNPTENTDGSTLTDLAGIVLYWDSQSGVGRCSNAPAVKLDPCYANALDLNSNTVTSSAITLNLNADTTIYFAGAAYNTNDLLSDYSSETEKIFTLVVNAPPNPPTIQSVDLTITCTTNLPGVSCTFDVQ